MLDPVLQSDGLSEEEPSPDEEECRLEEDQLPVGHIGSWLEDLLDEVLTWLYDP